MQLRAHADLVEAAQANQLSQDQAINLILANACTVGFETDTFEILHDGLNIPIATDPRGGHAGKVGHASERQSPQLPHTVAIKNEYLDFRAST